MLTSRSGLVLVFAMSFCCFHMVQAAEPTTTMASARRETVLDRKVFIQKGVAEIPQVPPLCDSLKLQKRRVDVGDCKLFCEVEGRGKALVLINGGPGGTHHDFHPDFGRMAKFATVVYYDQRGCGFSDYAKDDGYTIAQAADDLDKLRQALRIDQWTVLGWSYGGVVAQRYTVKYADHVSGLVLVGSSTDGHRIALEGTRQYDYMSRQERAKIDELYGNEGLSTAQLVYNLQLNGDWKRQNFYRPTQDELAREAIYGWKHDPAFRRSICRQLPHFDLGEVFENCPIPILLVEGKYDLTWSSDKAGKLHACFPGSKLVMFERSSHQPFADEPEKFFQTLREFMANLPTKTSANTAKWKEQAALQQAQRENSPEYLIQSVGWGKASSERIVAQYSAAWLNHISDPLDLLKLGFALNDSGKHADALAAFERMLEKSPDQESQGVALVWQGHMLDLLGKRQQAVEAYKKAAAIDLDSRHDQYGLALNKAYIQQRIKTPFTGVKNRDKN